ncbi:hypothetical protein RB598_008983 [Gaeumannomyces tritici]
MRRLASTPHLHLLLHVLLLVSGAAAGVLRAAITLSLPTATATTTPPPKTTLAPHLQLAVFAAAAAATTPTPQVQFTTNSRILACWATMEQLGGSAGGLMHATPTAPAALALHLATQPAGSSHCTTRLPQSVMSEYADFTESCWRWMSTISTSWARFATQCPEFVGTRPFIRGDWDVTVRGFCPTTATVFWTAAAAAPTILEAVATPTGLGHLIGARAPAPTPVRAMVNSTTIHTAGAARAGSSRGLGLLVAGVAVGSAKLFSIL